MIRKCYRIGASSGSRYSVHSKEALPSEFVLKAIIWIGFLCLLVAPLALYYVEDSKGPFYAFLGIFVFLEIMALIHLSPCLYYPRLWVNVDDESEETESLNPSSDQTQGHYQSFQNQEIAYSHVPVAKRDLPPLTIHKLPFDIFHV